MRWLEEEDGVRVDATWERTDAMVKRRRGAMDDDWRREEEEEVEEVAVEESVSVVGSRELWR